MCGTCALPAAGHEPFQRENPRARRPKRAKPWFCVPRTLPATSLSGGLRASLNHIPVSHPVGNRGCQASDRDSQPAQVALLGGAPHEHPCAVSGLAGAGGSGRNPLRPARGLTQRSLTPDGGGHASSSSCRSHPCPQALSHNGLPNKSTPNGWCPDMPVWLRTVAAAQLRAAAAGIPPAAAPWLRSAAAGLRAAAAHLCTTAAGVCAAVAMPLTTAGGCTPAGSAG